MWSRHLLTFSKLFLDSGVNWTWLFDDHEEFFVVNLLEFIWLLRFSSDVDDPRTRHCYSHFVFENTDILFESGFTDTIGRLKNQNCFFVFIDIETLRLHFPLDVDVVVTELDFACLWVIAVNSYPLQTFPSQESRPSRVFFPSVVLLLITIRFNLVLKAFLIKSSRVSNFPLLSCSIAQ